MAGRSDSGLGCGRGGPGVAAAARPHAVPAEPVPRVRLEEAAVAAGVDAPDAGRGAVRAPGVAAGVRGGRPGRVALPAAAAGADGDAAAAAPRLRAADGGPVDLVRRDGAEAGAVRCAGGGSRRAAVAGVPRRRRRDDPALVRRPPAGGGGELEAVLPVRLLRRAHGGRRGVAARALRPAVGGAAPAGAVGAGGHRGSVRRPGGLGAAGAQVRGPAVARGPGAAGEPGGAVPDRARRRGGGGRGGAAGLWR